MAMSAIAAVDTQTGVMSIFIILEQQMAVIPHRGSGEPYITQEDAQAYFNFNAEPLRSMRMSTPQVSIWGAEEEVMPAPPREPEVYVDPAAKQELVEKFMFRLADMSSDPADVITKAKAYADAWIADLME